MWIRKLMNNQNENQTCQNCKKDHTIVLEDFNFYKKLKVPLPTFCPECRMQRRMMFRNERVLYKGICNLCNKNIITIFNQDEGRKVYCGLKQLLNFPKKYLQKVGIRRVG